MGVGDGTVVGTGVGVAAGVGIIIGVGAGCTVVVGFGVGAGAGVCKAYVVEVRSGIGVAVASEAILVIVDDEAVVVGSSRVILNAEGEGENITTAVGTSDGVEVGALEKPIKLETAVATETMAAMIPLRKEGMFFAYG